MRLINRNLLTHLSNLLRGQPRLPPSNLRVHVNGREDLRLFLNSGNSVQTQMKQALQSVAGKQLAEFDRILDFGVGCGRLERWFGPEILAKLSGVDVSADAIGFCQKNLKGQYQAISTEPPLPFDANSFDLVISFSVFSHMDIDTATPWIEELARVVRTGGILLITTHMDWCAQNLLSQEELLEYEQQGWCGIPYRAAGSHHAEYINAYYSEAVWKSLWQPGFEFLGLGYGRDANEFSQGAQDQSGALLPMGQALSILRKI